MYVYHMQAMSKILKADTGSPEIIAKDSCELPFGCWESNFNSLEKKKNQPMFLTKDSSLQLASNLLKKKNQK